MKKIGLRILFIVLAVLAGLTAFAYPVALAVMALFIFLAVKVDLFIKGKGQASKRPSMPKEQKQKNSKQKQLKSSKRLDVRDDRLVPMTRLDEIMTTQNYAVLDVETTGLDPTTERIIEIAILKIVNGEPTAKYQTLVDPGKKVPSHVTELTGITTEQVKNEKSYQTMCEEIVNFLGFLPVVAHNSLFDARFVSAAFTYFGFDRTIRHIDTIALAKQAFPDAPNYKLATLIPFLNLSDHDQTHRAMDDVYCTQRLFELCKQTIHAKNVLSSEIREASSAIDSISGTKTTVDVFLAYEQAEAAVQAATEKDAASAETIFGTDGKYLEKAFSRAIYEVIDKDFEREKKAIQKLKTRKAMLSHVEKYKTLFSSNADKLMQSQNRKVAEHEKELLRICDMIAPE